MTIAVGSDADLAIIDLDKEQKVTADLLLSGQQFSNFQDYEIKDQWVPNKNTVNKIINEEIKIFIDGGKVFSKNLLVKQKVTKNVIS